MLKGVRKGSLLILQQCICSGEQVNGMGKSPALPDIQELPPSRPLTPIEQMDIMLAIEEEEKQSTGIPSERDEEVRDF